MSVRSTQKCALLVWETGAGFTHAQNILGVAGHLRQQGIACFAALADTRFDPWFRRIGCPTLQTYLGPVMRNQFATPEPRPARVLSDMLANQGFFQTDHAAAFLAHYETLFQLIKPDIVLCENAPGAVLAARGRIPAIVYGSSLMTMPPLKDGRFAHLDPAQPEPSWDQSTLLDDINVALASAGRPLLSSTEGVLDCSAMLPFGPAAFDPYAQSRTDVVLAPHCPDLPAGTRAGTAQSIAVYLHEGAQYIPAVIEGLSMLPGGTQVFIPSLQPHRRHALEASGLVVHPDRFSLEFLRQQAGCLVHHGGVTLTAVALALGIPQIVLARFHENGIAGRFVHSKGLGHVARIDTVEPHWLAEAAIAVSSDGNMQRKALEAAPAYREWFKEDPTEVVARTALQMLANQRKGPPGGPPGVTAGAPPG